MNLFISGSTLKSSLISFLIFIILLAPIVRGILGFQPYLPMFFVMLLFSFLFLFLNYYKGFVFFYFLILFGSAFVFVALTKFEDSSALYFSLLNLVNLMIGCWLARQDQRQVLALSLSVLLLYYFLFLFLGLIYGFLPDDINYFFKNSSRNAVSAAALFFQIFYSASYFRVYRKLPYVTPVITFLIAFLAYGRAGIALSLLIVMWTFGARLWAVRIGYKVLFIFLGLSVFVLGVQNFDLIEYYLVTQTNFSQGFESPRALMIRGYIDELNLLTFLFGVDLSSIPIIEKFSNNPHNSVVFGHSMFGFFHILFLVSYFIAFLGVKRFSKITLVYALLALLLFVRSLTDIVALPGVYDFIFFYILFVAVFSISATKPPALSG